MSIRYILYFLLIPIGYLNPILNWLVIIFGPFLLYTPLKKLIVKEQRRYFLALVLFLFVVLITGVFSVDPQYPVKNALNIISILTASYFVSARLKNKQELVHFIDSVLLASIAFTLMLYTFTFNGFTFAFSESETFGKNGSSVILFIGLVANMLKIELTKSNLLLKIVNFIFIISIFFTGSIKIILVSTLLLIVFLFFKSGFKLRSVFSGILILSVFIFFVTQLTSKNDYFDNYAVNRITSRLSVLFGGESEIGYIDADYMTGARTYLINQGLELFYQNPFFGIGLENTRIYIGTYTHNNFVEILAGTGVIGFFFFVYALITVIKSCIRVKNNQIKIILLASVGCFVLIANAQRIYDNRYLMVFLVSFLPIYNMLNYEKK